MCPLVIIPTGPFTIWELLDQEIDRFYVTQKHRAFDFEAPTLWKGSSGLREVANSGDVKIFSLVPSFRLRPLPSPKLRSGGLQSFFSSPRDAPVSSSPCMGFSSLPQFVPLDLRSPLPTYFKKSSPIFPLHPSPLSLSPFNHQPFWLHLHEWNTVHI